MPRSKVKINPERGKRLKMLIEMYGIDQNTLAERINYSPEHISYVINGKRNLTENMASVIVQQIDSRINKQWLLGYGEVDKPFTIIEITVPGLDEARKIQAVLGLLTQNNIEVWQISDNGKRTVPVSKMGGFMSAELDVEIQLNGDTVWRGKQETAKKILLEISEYALFKIKYLGDTEGANDG